MEEFPNLIFETIEEVLPFGGYVSVCFFYTQVRLYVDLFCVHAIFFWFVLIIITMFFSIKIQNVGLLLSMQNS